MFPILFLPSPFSGVLSNSWALFFNVIYIPGYFVWLDLVQITTDAVVLSTIAETCP